MLTHLHDGMDNKYQGCFADVAIVLYTVCVYKTGRNLHSCKIYHVILYILAILLAIHEQ